MTQFCVDIIFIKISVWVTKVTLSYGLLTDKEGVHCETGLCCVKKGYIMIHEVRCF